MSLSTKPVTRWNSTCGVHLFVFCSLVVQAQAILSRSRIRGNAYRLRGEKRALPISPSAVLMAPGVMTCPSGQQIMSQHACEAAFEAVVRKYDYESADDPYAPGPTALLVSWPHIPHACSVSKGKAYFNTDDSQAVRGDSAVLSTLNFRTVCAPATYTRVWRAKFCKGSVLNNGGGATARGSFRSQAACQEECDTDPRCEFFLWKHEPGTSWVFHCATFTNCDTPAAYEDGKTALVYQKLPTNVPEKESSEQAEEHVKVAPSGGSPADSSRMDIDLRFRVVLMAPGVASCPSGQQITSQPSCDAAFENVVKKYGYDPDRPRSLLVSWAHIPHGCSVSKGKAYFNADASQPSRGDSAVVDSLNFRAVCAPAAYKEFVRDKFCKGPRSLLYNGGGAQAQGSFRSLAACQEECDRDPRCKFFLWKDEPGTSWAFHCATFTQCDAPEIYADGKVVIYKKLNTTATHKGFHANTGSDTTVESTTEVEQSGLAKSGSFHVHSAAPPSGLHFSKISPGSPYAAHLLPAAPAPAPVAAASPAPAHIPWFACQLVAGSVKMSWQADSTIVMTKNVTRTDKASGWKFNQLVYYRGKWSIENENVLLEWEALPPWRLRTTDGGSSFHKVFQLGKAQQYTCTKPPPALAKMISAGMEKARLAHAEAQRTQAGLPTDYTTNGCRQAVMPVRKDTFRAPGMSLEVCFTHCGRMRGMHYFSVTRGDTCFCSEAPPGKPGESEDCDVKCDGNPEEYCGGFSTAALGYFSVYTMVDCLPPGAEELKQDAAARLARLQALYANSQHESCGEAKGNLAKIDGSSTLAGSVTECQQACIGAKGAQNCHGFTYDARRSKCVFHVDAFSGVRTKNDFFTCYYKKSVPLLGIRNALPYL